MPLRKFNQYEHNKERPLTCSSKSKRRVRWCGGGDGGCSTPSVAVLSPQLKLVAGALFEVLDGGPCFARVELVRQLVPLGNRGFPVSLRTLMIQGNGGEAWHGTEVQSQECVGGGSKVFLRVCVAPAQH